MFSSSKRSRGSEVDEASGTACEPFTRLKQLEPLEHMERLKQSDIHPLQILRAGPGRGSWRENLVETARDRPCSTEYPIALIFSSR